MAILGGLLGGIGGMGQDWWKRLGGGAQSLVQGMGPQDDEWTRAAMQAGGMQQEPMATRQGGGGLLGGIFNGGKVNFNDLGGRFAQAGAMMSGEWDSAANIAQNRAQLQGLRAKQMAEAQQQQQNDAALEAMGYTPQERQLLLSGTMSNKDLRPDAPQPTNAEREASWYAGATPEQRAAYDQMHPVITNGFGSTVVPRNSWGQGNNQDATPTVEDGHQYTPGPGGRANPANWKELGGVSGSPAGVGFRPRR